MQLNFIIVGSEIGISIIIIMAERGPGGTPEEGNTVLGYYNASTLIDDQRRSMRLVRVVRVVRVMRAVRVVRVVKVVRVVRAVKREIQTRGKQKIHRSKQRM